jgi:hypothetical protein
MGLDPKASMELSRSEEEYTFHSGPANHIILVVTGDPKRQA